MYQRFHHVRIWRRRRKPRIANIERLEDRRLLAFDDVVINEIMGIDRNGIGWVELHNTSNESIDLSTGALTSEVEFFQLPAVDLEAKQYIVFTSSDFGDELLGPEPGYLALFDLLNDQVVHEVNYPAQREDVSYGLTNSEFHYLDFPTPGVANSRRDPGSNAATATQTEMPFTVFGNIAPTDDLDWFGFEAIGRNSYQFETRLDSLEDTVLRIFDSDRTLLTENNDFDGGFASRIEWTAEASGTYFVEVSSFDNGFGTYFIDGSELVADIPEVTIDLPADTLGRYLIGNGPGVMAQISVTGTDPTPIVVGQSGVGGLLLGPDGDPSISVLTPGGPNNVTEVLVRADPVRLSDSVDDVTLLGSANGQSVFELPVTAYELAIEPSATLVNDAVGSLIAHTTPAIPGFVINTSAFSFGRRRTNEPDGLLSATNLSLEILNQGLLVFDAEGQTIIDVRSGPAGQGEVIGELVASTGAAVQFESILANRILCAPCCECDLGSNNDGRSMGSVHLYAGEKVVELSDMEIRGRGFDFTLSRTYRSQASHLRDVATGDFGVDWAFSYSDDRLIKDGDNVIVYRPDLRTDTFVAGTGLNEFIAPQELYAQLKKKGGRFELREANGMVKTYEDFSHADTPGRLVRVEDRHGNYMTLHYAQIDPDNQRPGNEKFVLSHVIDTLGREIRYQYYARTQQPVAGRQLTRTHATGNAAAWGRLARVIDFKGDMDFDGRAMSTDFLGQTNNRTVTFDYDDEGNLVSVTSPVVTNTPHDNEFPEGKTVRYEYVRDADVPAAITGMARQRLLHNLESIEAPNEVAVPGQPPNPREELTYFTDPIDLASFDRVETYGIGGTNRTGVPAGGARGPETGRPIEYQYEILGASAATTNDVFLKSTVTDRRGNMAEYEFSPFETLITKRELTRGFRATDPAAYVTQYRYNDDKRLVQTSLPQGNVVDHIFDDDNLDRFQQGNPNVSIFSPDARGGDHDMLETRKVFEPIYQQLASIIDPRGLAPDFEPPIADPSGRTLAERYTTRFFFDYQESREQAASAPDTRLDIDGSNGRVNRSPLIAFNPSVLTTEVWLVQELNLPETSDGLAELRRRLNDSEIQLGLGDLNADNDELPRISGDVIREVLPSPVLLDGSNQHSIETAIESTGDLIGQVDTGLRSTDAKEGIHHDRLQTVATLYQYNRFGQLTERISPEGNVTSYRYFPESDPDGDTQDADIVFGAVTPMPQDGRILDDVSGGYLRQIVGDTDRVYFDETGVVSDAGFSNNHQNPAITRVANSFFYDDVGNLITSTNGRGIRTDYFVNELDQAVQVVHAADVATTQNADPPEPLELVSFGYLERIFFDHNNNLVRRQIEDRGNTSDVFTLLPGDANGDGQFNSNDLIQVFIVGEFEDGVQDNSTWQEGDWTRDDLNDPAPDGDFNASDLVAAFELGIYERGPYATTAFVDHKYRFDILDNLVETREEVAGGFEPEILITRLRYDANENQVLTIFPEGNAISLIYDERDLLFRSTRGALSPPELDAASPAATSRTLLATSDSTSYDVRGGIQCQCQTFHYDGNGNIIETVDADDTDLSPDNNSDIGGPGDRTRYIYDGFDRLTSVIDSVGNQSVHQYDAADNEVRMLRFGPVDGNSPTSDGPDVVALPVSSLGTVQSAKLVNPNLLEATEAVFDELNREIQSNRVLFVNTIPTTRPVDVADGGLDIQKGDLTPGDNQPIPGVVGVNVLGRVSHRFEYDRASRPTFSVEDDEDTSRSDYDGASRVVRELDAEGNTVEMAYDDSHNEIERSETDVSRAFVGTSSGGNSATTLVDNRATWNDGQWTVRQVEIIAGAGAGQFRTIRANNATTLTIDRAWDVVPDATSEYVIHMVAPESFLTTYFYDSLNRVQQTVDSIGQAISYRYDSRDNLVAMADSQGPMTGSSIARRHFGNSLVETNDFGNVTRYFYDGINREIREDRILTVLPQEVTGTSTGGNTANTLRDATAALGDHATPNQLVVITDGTGTGQVREIVSNTETELVVSRDWETIPDATSAYQITSGTASGDGIHVGASIFGVKDDRAFPDSFIPTVDPRQGGGDGIIRTGSTYDLNSLPSARVDDQGNVTLYLYDNLDRRITETKGLVTTSSYSEQLALGDRRVVTPTASTINNPAFIPEPQIQAQMSDAGHRIAAIADLFPPLGDDVADPPPPPQATTIVYGYDPDDNVLILEDENDSEVFTKYDAVDRDIAVRVFRAEGNPPMRAPDSHAGDGFFAPVPSNDFRGSPRGPYPETIGTNAQDWQYDGLSRLVLATDNNDPSAGSADDSFITFAYDSLSRVIEEEQHLGNLSRVISSAWRADELRSGLIYPNDRKLVFSYDQLDRLDHVSDISADGSVGTIADYAYVGTDRVLVRSYPENGTRMSYLDDTGTMNVGYDALRRPAQVRHLRMDNSLIVGFTHSYDRMNNKLSEEKLHDAVNSELYSYDGSYRLVDFERPNPGALNALHSDWTLDGVGNWAQVVSDDGDAATNEVRLHSSLNEIMDRSGVGTVYSDDNGNRVDDGELGYLYDFKNRLRKVLRNWDTPLNRQNELLIAEYFYDPNGRRVRKVVDNSGDSNGTTDFLYDGWRVIEERDPNGDPDRDVVRQYVYGSYIDEPLILDRRSGEAVDHSAIQRLFYHHNSLYSVFALTDTSGEILEGYLYDAYGGHTLYEPGDNGVVDFGGDDIVRRSEPSKLGNPFLFTSRRWDSETGHYFHRTRYLHVSEGRFLSRDTIGIWGDPSTLGHGYIYAAGQPINFLDPLGTEVYSKTGRPPRVGDRCTPEGGRAKLCNPKPCDIPPPQTLLMNVQEFVKVKDECGRQQTYLIERLVMVVTHSLKGKRNECFKVRCTNGRIEQKSRPKLENKCYLQPLSRGMDLKYKPEFPGGKSFWHSEKVKRLKESGTLKKDKKGLYMDIPKGK